MSLTRPIALIGLLLVGARAGASAQCVVPKESNEAKLLAFYEAPIAFSPAAAPSVLPPGSVRIDAELAPVPNPSPELRRTGYCFSPKTEQTRLAPVFGRPRIAIGLPGGLVLEGSYLPPITISDAEPNLASFALSAVRRLGAPGGFGSPTLLIRAHGTVGSVRGPITCPHEELQMSQPLDPCYGTRESHDTFHPYMFGAEGALGLTVPSGWLSVYAGGGVSWLRPRFQVGFDDANGIPDRTRVQVDLTRGTVFGGLTARVASAFELSAQVYSVPADVTTWRFGAGYRLR